jgi:DNA-binding IscR family transcriptional regulator
VLDVVLAVEGDETAFRCDEIRQRGPVTGPPSTYRRPCVIARTMWDAEAAWRRELAAVSIGDLVLEVMRTVPAGQLAEGATWIAEIDVQRRKRRTR